MYQISCFADEISDEFSEQLDVMERFGIRWLSLRSAFGKGVMDLTDEEVDRIAAELKARGMGVSSIGSPIGKTDILDDSGEYLRQTARAIEIAKKVNAPRIRVFSFYMDHDKKDEYRAESVRRLTEMADLAAESGMALLHENEAGIYGEESERCLDLMQSVSRPNFQAVFDPSNFVAAGEDPFEESLPRMKEYVAYMHIKDSRRSDGVIVPAGEGDGHVSDVLKALSDRDLFLTLEPHLALAEKKRGFTGVKLFEKAYNALTGLLKEAGLQYC